MPQKKNVLKVKLIRDDCLDDFCIVFYADGSQESIPIMEMPDELKIELNLATHQQQ